MCQPCAPDTRREVSIPRLFRQVGANGSGTPSTFGRVRVAQLGAPRKVIPLWNAALTMIAKPMLKKRQRVSWPQTGIGRWERIRYADDLSFVWRANVIMPRKFGRQARRGFSPNFGCAWPINAPRGGLRPAPDHDVTATLPMVSKNARCIESPGSVVAKCTNRLFTTLDHDD